MIHIRIHNEKQNQELEHAAGPIEFGRGPQQKHRRFVIDDVFFSRDQLRVEEVGTGRVRLDNLSQKNAMVLANGKTLAVGSATEADLPLAVTLGKTRIELESAKAEADFDRQSLLTVRQPMLTRRADLSPMSLSELGETPSPEKLAHWLETVIALQRSALGSADFNRQTAKAMVELVNLDVGIVLSRHGESWSIAAHHINDGTGTLHYSRTLLNHVASQRQTFYQDLGSWSEQTLSLENIAAVVVSPIFGMNDDVVGALYGVRNRRALTRVGPIKPLEAQVVQLLAAAAGANLVHAVATRTRVQFEQFFSPELVRELERDPNLLEGRNQEVTVLVSDLRGFSSLSERLGAQNTCRLIRDMMERLSDRIVEQGGVIVDYAGDGILAMWNAPASQPDHALRACTAALAMQAEMPGLNETWHEMVGGPLHLGVGINTGSAQVGNTGSSRKFKYGPHGHTVNLASRVQDATKKLALPILITGATRAGLPETYAIRRLGKVRLAGMAEPVDLFELHGDQASPAWLAQRDLYEQALGFYETRQWSKACQTLMQLPELAQQKDHYDSPTLKLMKRAWGCLESPPEGFDAVIE